MSAGSEHPVTAKKGFILETAAQAIQKVEASQLARDLFLELVGRRLCVMEAIPFQSKVLLDTEAFKNGMLFAGVHFERKENDPKEILGSLLGAYGVVGGECIPTLRGLQGHPFLHGYMVARFSFSDRPNDELRQTCEMLVQGVPVVIVTVQSKRTDKTPEDMKDHIRCWDLCTVDLDENHAAVLGGPFFPNATVMKVQDGKIRGSRFGKLAKMATFLNNAIGSADRALRLPCPLSLGQFLVSVTKTLTPAETRGGHQMSRMFTMVSERYIRLVVAARGVDYAAFDLAVHAMRVCFFILFPRVWSITEKDLEPDDGFVACSLRAATHGLVKLELVDQIDDLVSVAEAQVLGATIFGFCFENLWLHFENKLVIFDVSNEHIWRVPREVRTV